LAQHDLLHFSGGDNRSAWTLLRNTDEAKISVSPRLRINNSFAVRDAALQGLGIARLPLAVVSNLPETRHLKRVLPEWCPAPVPVNAVFPGLRYLTPKVRAFIDHAVERFDDS
jgi:LysR family transcriptional regulator for bpeEF and oprC